MKYDFDTIINRQNTMSIKYDFAKRLGKPESILPLWVADMDFQTAPEILEVLEERIRHGIFGYSESEKGYADAVIKWYQDHFQWKIERNWIVKTPGVVFALAVAVRAFTKEGDGVLIQRPVYYPFSQVIENNHRVVVNSPLKLVGNHYEIDFEDLERKIVSDQVKLFLFCSPHNPTGRVWKEWELRKIGDICLKHNVLIVSDEIHSDFINFGHIHHVFSNLDKKYAENIITCTAPTKTFNLAGLQISNIVISNTKLRRKFRDEKNAIGYSHQNIMGLLACQAAYEKGEAWYRQLKEYLSENLSFLKDYIEVNLPNIRVIEPEGTYLVWLDFRKLGLHEEEIEDLIINRAGLWLDQGSMFGSEGKGFERINIACPRKILWQALKQLKNAIS